jgi:broad specificity phosphatase PhoE
LLIRHADPVVGGTDPGLSTAGQHRAATLAKMLKDGGIKAIFTSELRRTKETAAPLASLLSITPAVIADDPAAAADQIEHGFQVIGHELTGGVTHPYDIHEILTFYQHLNVGYDLSV